MSEHYAYLSRSNGATTLNTPHRKVRVAGKTWYVATMPEGDYIIHEHNPGYQEGYGGQLVSFLLEDGTVETVKGPFNCGDAFDGGCLQKLESMEGFERRGPAFRIVAGRNLWICGGKGERQVVFEEASLATGNMQQRLQAAIDLPGALDVDVEFRNSTRHLSHKQAIEYSQDR